MNRRKIISRSAVAASAISLSPSHSYIFTRSSDLSKNLFIGTQVLPEYHFEQSIAECLDRMQELGGIKTVITFTHAQVFHQYNTGFEPKTDSDGHPITNVFVNTHAEYFADPALQGRSPATKFDGRDITDELY